MHKHKIANVAAMVDSAIAAKQEKKRIARQLRKERKAERKALLRGRSENRTYTATIPGATLNIRWMNGCQQVAIEYDHTEKENKVDEVTVSLPIVKMTWKQLRAEVIAGNTVYTRSNKKIPCTKRAEVMPDKEVKVSVESFGKTKIYRLT